MKQKEAVCRRCGRKIWLVECDDRWVACDQEICMFQPGQGPDTYVTQDGQLANGFKAAGGVFGYRRHRKDCAGASA